MKFGFRKPSLKKSFKARTAAKIKKAGAKGSNEIVATITKEELQKIAETKLPDLNAYDLKSAMNIIAGTAKNMGIAIEGFNETEVESEAEEASEDTAE